MNPGTISIPDEQAVLLETGFLLAAELTGGHGSAETGSGHARRDRTKLLEIVAERLTPGLRIERLEGERLLASARVGELPKAALLLDLIDGAYVAFRGAQVELLDSRKCTCDGCLGSAAVTLRFVAHYGRWLRVEDGCNGDDATHALALLADSALEPGSRLLVTGAALRRTGVDPAAAGMQTLGEGEGEEGAVADLALAWEEDPRSVRLDPKDAVATIDLVLPVSLPDAWDWLTAPDKRTLWEEVDSIELTPRVDGRAGVGTRYRSLHGKRVDEVREVLDWRPFRGWTWDLVSRTTRVRATVELTEMQGGTRVVNTMGVPAGTSLLAGRRARRAIRSSLAPLRSKTLGQLQALLRVERSTGL